MLKRRDILKTIFREIVKEKAVVITTTGLIGREAFELMEFNKHLYMAGSMGLVGAIGLGIALSRQDIKVISIDGDGSFLMNLGEVCTIGNKKPQNLIHIVLDNGVYYSTGGMKTYSSGIDLCRLAEIAGYEICWEIRKKKDLRKFSLMFKKKGPIFIRVFIQPKGRGKLPRPKRLEEFHFKLKEVIDRWNY